MSELVRFSTRPQTPTILTRARSALQAARSAWSGSYSLKDPALARLYGSGYEAYAGIPVTEQNALTFSAVFSAVLQISSDVAKLPLNLHKRRQDGGSDHYIDSRLYHLLKHEPNPEMSSMMFRQTLTAHALTCHGGYAEIERDLHGRPRALWLLTPDRVEPFRREQFDRSTGRKVFGPLEYRIDGDDDQILQARDVIHVSGLGYDGITGYSVIHKARQAIGLALAMEKFGGQYFGKGTMFGGWLETDVDLDDDQKTEIKDSIEKFRQSQDSAWRILVTGVGHKFHQFASKPSESQMDESRTAQILEVARFFRMPPVKLGVNTPGTVSYASSEQADLDYYKGPMLDWITREEQELNRKLIPASERRQQYIKHNASAFLRADTAARTAYYEKMLLNGVFNADMVLELEDMNPQPGGQGKMFLVQGAMIAKDQLAALTDAKITQAKTPPRPVGASSDDDGSREAIEALAARIEQMSAMVVEHGTKQAQIDDLRTELDTIRQEKADADAAVIRATVDAERLEAERAEAVARAQQAEADAARTAGERDTAHSQAAELTAVASAKSIEAVAAEAARQAAEADRTATIERLHDLQARCEALDAEMTQARATIATMEAAAAEEASAAAQLKTEIETARAQETTALEHVSEVSAHADAAVNELKAQLEAREAAHAEALEEATRAAESTAAQLTEAQTMLTHAQETGSQTIAALTADVERLTAHLEGERATRIERLTTMIAAHRGLLVDAIGRMARRQAQQARAKQATPEKLRRWLEGLSAEMPICVEALLPTMRARLAAQASTEDPVAVTTALVVEHMQAFEALIRDVLSVPPEDFHAELERVLTRWESDRPGQVADRLMEQEIRYARSL